MNPAFSIQRSKGFQIVFPNQVRVSVQFGAGNYCDNYNSDDWEGKKPAESANAEVAVINDANGSWLTRDLIPDLDGDVAGHFSAEQVLDLLNKAAEWRGNDK